MSKNTYYIYYLKILIALLLNYIIELILYKSGHAFVFLFSFRFGVKINFCFWYSNSSCFRQSRDNRKKFEMTQKDKSIRDIDVSSR